MKQHLYTKLLILYFVLGGICFLLLSSGGSYLVEKRLERSTGESLYRAASQMVSGNELRQSVKDPEHGSLSLTPLGKETAENLRQALPSSLRDNVVQQGMELLSRLRRKNEVAAKILPDGKGFRVVCSVHEGDLDFFTLTFYAPDREQAQIISKNFTARSTEIYRDLVRTLTASD